MNKKPEFPEKMKLTLACKYLGISFTKLTSLIKSGELQYETSTLDCRLKLVKRSDLDELLNKPRKKRLKIPSLK